MSSPFSPLLLRRAEENREDSAVHRFGRRRSMSGRDSLPPFPAFSGTFPGSSPGKDVLPEEKAAEKTPLTTALPFRRRKRAFFSLPKKPS